MQIKAIYSNLHYSMKSYSMKSTGAEQDGHFQGTTLQIRPLDGLALIKQAGSNKWILKDWCFYFMTTYILLQ